MSRDVATLSNDVAIPNPPGDALKILLRLRLGNRGAPSHQRHKKKW